jgi:hypothetical protein
MTFVQRFSIYFSLFALILVALTQPAPVSAQAEIGLDTTPIAAEIAPAVESVSAEEKIEIIFFDDRLCSVCAATKRYITDELLVEFPEMEFTIIPITDTATLMETVALYGVEDYRLAAPTIFVNGTMLQFADFTPRQAEMLRAAVQGELQEAEEGFFVKIPFTNHEINVSDFSLIFLTFLLGSIDGLNVCSIGALLVILSLVMVFDSKRKIFIFGGIFILTTILVYGTLVFAWGQLFQALVGHLEILRILVGLSALAGGIFFFRQFLRFYRFGPTCDSSGSLVAGKAMQRVQNALSTPGTGMFAILGSIAIFAFIITIVELPCSIGIPLAFTGILVESNLSLLAYSFYIGLYLFFYMLIEIIIFTGAVLTKKIWFAGARTITWVTFAGAAVLFYIAIHYLF